MVLWWAWHCWVRVELGDLRGLFPSKCFYDCKGNMAKIDGTITYIPCAGLNRTFLPDSQEGERMSCRGKAPLTCLTLPGSYNTED